MKDRNIGLIGIGSLGKNLANNILLAGYSLYINDLNKKNSKDLINKGAKWCNDLEYLTNKSSVIITCLPNPKSVSLVIESKKGILNYINKNHLIIECSTTDEEELIRISKLIKSKSANYIEAPLTGGEWKCKNGNISILVAGKKRQYKRALPILKEIGYEIIFVSEILGTASTIKVLTNYLASINLVAIGEVFMICKKYGIDLKTAYRAIEISSGNSFVHTSEGQLILSRSMNAQFTMDLICKDLRLVEKLRKKFDIPSNLIKQIVKIFNEGKKNLGKKEYSTAIVKMLENKCNDILYARGFPKILIDNEPRRKGREVKI